MERLCWWPSVVDDAAFEPSSATHVHKTSAPWRGSRRLIPHGREVQDAEIQSNRAARRRVGYMFMYIAFR